MCPIQLARNLFGRPEFLVEEAGTPISFFSSDTVEESRAPILPPRTFFEDVGRRRSIAHVCFPPEKIMIRSRTRWPQVVGNLVLVAPALMHSGTIYIDAW